MVTPMTDEERQRAKERAMANNERQRGDDLVKRLCKADEYEPLGHDGWEAADRIEELEAENARLGQQCEGLMQAAMNNGQALILAEAKLAKLTRAADRVHDSYWNSTDGIIVGMYDLGEALRDARTTLAAITETPHDRHL